MIGVVLNCVVFSISQIHETGVTSAPEEERDTVSKLVILVANYDY